MPEEGMPDWLYPPGSTFKERSEINERVLKLEAQREPAEERIPYIAEVTELPGLGLVAVEQKQVTDTETGLTFRTTDTEKLAPLVEDRLRQQRESRDNGGIGGRFGDLSERILNDLETGADRVSIILIVALIAAGILGVAYIAHTLKGGRTLG